MGSTLGCFPSAVVTGIRHSVLEGSYWNVAIGKCCRRSMSAGHGGGIKGAMEVGSQLWGSVHSSPVFMSSWLDLPRCGHLPAGPLGSRFLGVLWMSVALISFMSALRPGGKINVSLTKAC